jgi:type IV secretory pathway TrbD component
MLGIIRVIKKRHGPKERSLASNTVHMIAPSILFNGAIAMRAQLLFSQSWINVGRGRALWSVSCSALFKISKCQLLPLTIGVHTEAIFLYEVTTTKRAGDELTIN